MLLVMQYEGCSFLWYPVEPEKLVPLPLSVMVWYYTVLCGETMCMIETHLIPQAHSFLRDRMVKLKLCRRLLFQFSSVRAGLPSNTEHWTRMQPDGVRPLYIQSIESLGPGVKSLLSAELQEYISPVPTSDNVAPVDRKSTRLNSSHLDLSRMPSSA